MGGLTDWPRAVAGRTPAAKERRSLAQRSDLLIVPHSVIANRLRVPRYVPAGRWCHPDKSIRSCMPSVRPPLALASEIGWVKSSKVPPVLPTMPPLVGLLLCVNGEKLLGPPVGTRPKTALAGAAAGLSK